MSAAGHQSSSVLGSGSAKPNSILSSSKLSRQVPVGSRDSHEGNNVGTSNGTYARRNVASRRNKNSVDDKNDRRDWLAAKIASMSVAEVQEITGLTETAIHNIRRGKNSISHDNLCLLLEARPDFRAAFFQSVGGELLVDPGRVIAIERAINSVMRGEGDY